jgi:hypothetical protein
MRRRVEVGILLGGKMKFLDVVIRAIECSRKLNAEDEELTQRLGLTEGVSLDGPGQEYILASRPAAEELERFLEALSDGEVLRLQTLMYAGRDRDGNFAKLHKELSCTKERAIQTICEKALLGDFLADGLALAQKRFFDVDGEW